MPGTLLRYGIYDTSGNRTCRHLRAETAKPMRVSPSSPPNFVACIATSLWLGGSLKTSAALNDEPVTAHVNRFRQNNFRWCCFDYVRYACNRDQILRRSE